MLSLLPLDVVIYHINSEFEMIEDTLNLVSTCKKFYESRKKFVISQKLYINEKHIGKWYYDNLMKVIVTKPFVYPKNVIELELENDQYQHNYIKSVIPKSVKKLTVTQVDIEKLIPQGVEEISMYNCEQPDLDCIPESCKSLTFHSNYNYNFVKPFPQFLTKLVLPCLMENLDVSILPKTLQHLAISGNVKNLAARCTELKYLKILDSLHLTKNDIPRSVQELIIRSCTLNDPDLIPPGVKKLELSSIYNRINIPDGVTDLTISTCHLPCIPSSVVNLDLNVFTNIRSDYIPRSVRKLIITITSRRSHSEKIIPEGVTDLIITTDLLKSEYIPSTLEKLHIEFIGSRDHPTLAIDEFITPNIKHLSCSNAAMITKTIPDTVISLSIDRSDFAPDFMISNTLEEFTYYSYLCRRSIEHQLPQTLKVITVCRDFFKQNKTIKNRPDLKVVLFE